MSITHLTSTSQLDAILTKSSTKVSVIDFHATWCGPCHMIAPVYEQLANTHTNVNFLKCDVEAAQDVAGRYIIKAMPTFVFLKGSTEVHRIQGADRAALEATLSRLSSGSSGSTTAFAGKGQTLGGPTTPSATDTGPGGFVNLTPQVKVMLGLVGAYILLWYLS